LRDSVQGLKGSPASAGRRSLCAATKFHAVNFPARESKECAVSIGLRLCSSGLQRTDTPYSQIFGHLKICCLQTPAIGLETTPMECLACAPRQKNMKGDARCQQSVPLSRESWRCGSDYSSLGFQSLGLHETTALRVSHACH